jgi:hypothetical protein
MVQAVERDLQRKEGHREREHAHEARHAQDLVPEAIEHAEREETVDADDPVVHPLGRLRRLDVQHLPMDEAVELLVPAERLVERQIEEGELDEEPEHGGREEPLRVAPRAPGVERGRGGREQEGTRRPGPDAALVELLGGIVADRDGDGRDRQRNSQAE